MKWWDFVIYKVVKNTSETRASLDRYGSEYLMKLYEAITYDEYIETLHNYDLVLKDRTRKQVAALSKFMGANVN